MVPLQACAGWAKTVNCHAHPRILLPQNRCLPEPLAAPFPHQPEPRCNTLDFVPKSVCQGAKPIRIPAERVRTYAEKWQNFTISGCSFIGEYGILGLVQQIRIWRGDLHEKEHIKNRRFGNADYSCCIYNVCGEPSRNEFSLEQYHYLVTVWFVCSCDSRATYCT